MKRSASIVAVGLAVAVAFPGSAQAQFSSCNVSLYRNLDLTELNAESGNDCWGYVSQSGREYALMGLADKLTVVEITDPANPVIVGSVSHFSSLWGDIKVYNGYAYVSNESGGGIDVVNLNNVDNGVVTLVQRMTTGGLATTHNVALNTASGHLYLCGSNLNGGAPVVYSLANPAAPVEVGRWTQTSRAYHHDAQIVTYASGPYAGREILFGASTSRGLDILDVTDKGNIFLISRTPYPGVSYCHQVWADADLQHLYINDELNDVLATIVFDISDLSSPTLLNVFSSSAPTTDHNLYWRDGILYEANYKSGLRIFETSDPAAPLEIGYFDTYPEDDTNGFEGAWSNYPFFPSGTVIVSDINRGLFILDVSEALSSGIGFSFPNGRPETVDPAGSTILTVGVSGPGATPEATAATLHVDRGAGFFSVPMDAVGANTFETAFPPAVCEQEIDYYISVQTDGSGTQYYPCNAPTPVLSTMSSGTVTAVFADDFETNQDWTTGPNSATTGFWVRGNPIGTGAQPEDDHTPGAGVNCFFTGQNPGGSLGDGDVDGGTVRLNSPTINLAGIDAVVRYYRWYYERDLGGDDGFLVEVSNNDGLTWTTVEFLSPGSGGWVRAQFKVSDFVTPTSLVKVRFSATDGPASGDIVEAAIDDVEIGPLFCPTQSPDVDNDGDADLLDYAFFSSCFTGQGACPCVPTLYDLDGRPECDRADLDLDGDIDLADYELFEAGLTGP